MINKAVLRFMFCAAAAVVMFVTAGCGSKDASLARALELVEQGNYEKALPILKSVSSSRKFDNATVWCNLGICYWQTGDNANAIKALRRGVDLASGSPDAYEYLGRVYIDAGMLDEARDVLTTANQIGPGSSSVLTALGIAEMKAGRAREAFAAFTEALDHEREYPPALYNLAVLYRDTIKNAVMAERFFRRFLAAAPSDPRAREASAFLNSESSRTESPAKPFVERARRLLESEEYDAALLAVKEALSRDPDYADAVWHMAGILDHIRGDAASAVNYYDKFMEKYPDDRRSVQAQQRSRELKDAAAKAVRRAEIDTTVAVLLHDEGQAGSAREAFSTAYGWDGRGDKAKAKAFYKRALELDGGMSAAFNNIGLIYFTEKNLEGARESFQSAVNVDPGYADARYMLARTQHEMGDEAASVQNLNSVLREKPAFASAHYLLGVILAGEKHFEASRIHFDRYAQLTGYAVR